MNTCLNCGKVAGGQSNILQGCVCQYSMQAPPQPQQETDAWHEIVLNQKQFLDKMELLLAKTTAPPQPEQEQEPVKWPRTMERGALVQWLHFEMVQHTLDEGTIDKLIEDAQAIPATPPQRTWVGLTEQQLNDIENDFWVVISKHVFDAIEAKLKQNNGYAEEKNT